MEAVTESFVSLDCIIFGLQYRGGISNYWAKLVEWGASNQLAPASLIVPSCVTYRDFDSAWLSQGRVVREKIDPRIARFLPAPTSGRQKIFHTSYYRLPRGRVEKYVVTVYDFMHERYRKGLVRIVHSMQKRASIQRADAVLCISESTRRDVIDFFPGVDVGKLRVVHLGVDADQFFPEALALERADPETVMFVGHRVRYKRFDIAVEAVRQLRTLKLGVVGPPLTDSERATLRQQLGDRWIEYGSVDNATLRALYSSAYAFIFPSDYEGFGLPILEAMACGCPVVASGRSSLPEIGGSAALYAESQVGEAYAAQLQALASADVRALAVAAGLSRVTGFGWDQTIRETALAYMDVR